HSACLELAMYFSSSLVSAISSAISSDSSQCSPRSPMVSPSHTCLFICSSVPGPCLGSIQVWCCSVLPLCVCLCACECVRACVCGCVCVCVCISVCPKSVKPLFWLRGERLKPISLVGRGLSSLRLKFFHTLKKKIKQKNKEKEEV